jgi:hypothetical protein
LAKRNDPTNYRETQAPYDAGIGYLFERGEKSAAKSDSIGWTLRTSRQVAGLASLRQFLGPDAVPADYDVAGTLVYEPVPLRWAASRSGRLARDCQACCR